MSCMLELNGKEGSYREPCGPSWRTILLFAIWLIWKSKNQVVFNGKPQNPRLAIEISNRAMEFSFCASNSIKPSSMVMKQVRWEKPQGGWVKLNTDGASGSVVDRSGCGGIIRDENGQWITRFARRIGAANSFIAELWGLRRSEERL